MWLQKENSPHRLKPNMILQYRSASRSVTMFAKNPPSSLASDDTCAGGGSLVRVPFLSRKSSRGSRKVSHAVRSSQSSRETGMDRV